MVGTIVQPKQGEAAAQGPLNRARKALLVCGIASSLLYGSIIWAIRYPGYSPISQTVSELSAWGVSTRPLWIVLGSRYTGLILAFAVGVWASAGGKRTLRIASGLLFAYGLLGLAWPFAAMHRREVLAAGGATLADTGHLSPPAVAVLLMFAAMAFGAAAFGRRFRIYTISSIVVLLVFGALTGADAPRVESNLPTPWAGLWERISIGVFLVWIVALATVLWAPTRRSGPVYGAAAGPGPTDWDAYPEMTGSVPQACDQAARTRPS